MPTAEDMPLANAAAAEKLLASPQLTKEQLASGVAFLASQQLPADQLALLLKTLCALAPPGLRAIPRCDAAWEVDVCSRAIDDAAQIYEHVRVHLADVDEMQHPTDGGVSFCTCAGRFFSLRGLPGSDIRWLSVDDQATYDSFCDLFHRLLPASVREQLARVAGVEAALQVYSAFFVTRSECLEPTFHVDYADSVGTHALTLMTPLKDYADAGTFQLLYHEAAPPSRTARYVYSRGKAIIFGGGFWHSTEPGRSAQPDDAPHAYLCFTFGTDSAERWPEIAKTVAKQTRVLWDAHGHEVPSGLQVPQGACQRFLQVP